MTLGACVTRCSEILREGRQFHRDFQEGFENLEQNLILPLRACIGEIHYQGRGEQRHLRSDGHVHPFQQFAGYNPEPPVVRVTRDQVVISINEFNRVFEESKRNGSQTFTDNDSKIYRSVDRNTIVTKVKKNFSVIRCGPAWGPALASKILTFTLRSALLGSCAYASYWLTWHR